jgi:hypothetical protein
MRSEANTVIGIAVPFTIKYIVMNTNLNHEIGCILLTSPIFFPEEMWIQGPNDWSGTRFF